jgi:hypothetical protein
MISFLQVVESTTGRGLSLRFRGSANAVRSELKRAGFSPGDDVVVLSREVYRQLVNLQAGNLP